MEILIGHQWLRGRIYSVTRDTSLNDRFNCKKIVVEYPDPDVEGSDLPPMILRRQPIEHDFAKVLRKPTAPRPSSLSDEFYDDF